VIAAVLLPSVVVLAPNLPLTVRPVVLPRWFADVGPHLPPGRVVLTYPAAFSGLQSSQAWQAANGMRWAQAGGGGPAGVPQRAGRARPGFEVLADASLALGPAPLPTAANLTAVRHALSLWGVTTLVVPDDPGLAVYDRGRGSAYAVGFLTAVLGTPPSFDHDAWVWYAVRSAPPPRPVGTVTFATCTRPATVGRPSQSQVPDCILGVR